MDTLEASLKLDLLLEGCRELHISIDEHQKQQFSHHYNALADWNKRINLTSIVQPEAVQTLHFLDSLTVVNALPAGALQSSRVLDVGAGAGFPGIPLKIAFPGIKLELIESTAKKVNFLYHLIDHLGLDGVEVRHGRAEELATDQNLRESFDVVLARGLAKMATLVELTLSFLRPGGLLVAHKKGNIDQELTNATKAINIMGGKPANLRNVVAPGLNDGRVLVVVEKVLPTPVGYPRRAGLPAKQPIS